MIIKKIESGEIDSKAEYANRLTNYFLHPEKKNVHERVLYCASRGFFSDDLASAQAEMSAMAEGAKTSANPTMHLVMSWKEGEQPTNKQIDDAVTLLLEELGLQGHGVIYSVHLDTDNLHCHIAISRVHPITEKVVLPNRGFDLEAIHRAIARIEFAQGWQRESRSRYEVMKDGLLVKCSSSEGKSRQPKQPRNDMEHRTGAKSAQRHAIEQAGPVITRAQSWKELHQGLASVGMRYEKSGSGAVVFVGVTPVKASSIHRAASLKRLQKRLGQYQASDQLALVPTTGELEATPVVEAMQSSTGWWHAFTQERKAFFHDRDHAQRKLRNEQSSAKEALLASQRSERHKILSGNWTQVGLARQALRSILAAQHAAQKADLKAIQDAERLTLQGRFGRFPDYENWLRNEQHSDEADAWRYRHSQWPSFKPLKHEDEAGSESDTKPKDIRAFQATACGCDVHYGKASAHGYMQTVAFIDRGNQIDVCTEMDDDAILAAMQLATQKWGSFAIEGNEAFRRRCVEVAAKNGVHLVEPELQVQVESVRQRLRQDVQEAAQAKPIRGLKQYFQSMQVEKYRVTVSHKRGDGIKVTKRMKTVTGDQVELTVTEVTQALSSLQLKSDDGHSRAQDATIQPVFEDKMAFRLKGLSLEKIRELEQEGFTLRATVEIEPDRLDGLLTVPMAGLLHARESKEAWTRIMKFQFNVESEACGQGTVGHAIPGLAGSKFPEHVVKLQSSQPQDCVKSSDMIASIDSALQHKTIVRTHLEDSSGRSPIETVTKILSSKEVSYAAHYADICKHLNGIFTDSSRIDAQVALHLKMVGHDRDAVESMLVHCCPQHAMASQDRDWALYAKRAADYAWGPAGRCQEQLLRPNLEHFLSVEANTERPIDHPNGYQR
jgi:hypothetical protein